MKTLIHPVTGKPLIVGGRRRPTADALSKVPQFSKYALCAGGGSTLPPAPASCDYSLAAMPCLSLVMLNNQLGDCTCAGACHCLGIWTGNSGQIFTATDDQVLAMYEAIGGYVPGDQSTDNGCAETDVLDYLVRTGFPDGSQLAGYVGIDGTNQTEVMQACDLFEGLYFGVELPDAWTNPMPSGSGFTWDAAPPDSNQGHCFIATGYNDKGVQIDTWGLLGTVTWAAVAALTASGAGGQLYALLSPDMIAKATAKAPTGFDWAALQSDFQALQTAGRGGLV